jgi:hypothetical protein
VFLAGLPNPASPDTSAVFSITIGFVGTTHALARRMPRDEVQWHAFIATYAGASLGLLIYLTAIAIELY